MSPLLLLLLCLLGFSGCDFRAGLMAGWETRDLIPVATIAVFLLFTSVPAYFGAGLGYDRGALTGEDRRKTASDGAFGTTFWGVMAACALASFVLFMVLANAAGGGAIMTPMMGWVVMTFMIVLFGLVAGLIAGALAAVGAHLGAGTSRRSAQVMAAILAAVGAMLGPLLLMYLSKS